MKMGSWVLSDRESENKVYIYKEGPPQGIEKKIYKGNLVEFNLIYNSQGRMMGYCLNYKYSKKFPKCSLFNFFGIFYNTKLDNDPKDLKVEVIYDDQIVRFLAYHHKSGIKDYMLFGRWRTETELPQDLEQE